MHNEKSSMFYSKPVYSCKVYAIINLFFIQEYFPIDGKQIFIINIIIRKIFEDCFFYLYAILMNNLFIINEKKVISKKLKVILLFRKSVICICKTFVA